MEQLLEIMKLAQTDFKTRMHAVLSEQGGLTLDQYQRFLSMQYHLTNGVQKHFYAIAGHPCMAKKKSLKNFLVNFANEEEPHYLIAEKDLKNLGLPVLPINFDTELWWAYFDKILPERPFVRLGGTCILENISTDASSDIKALLGGSEFLTPKNTVFIVIHQHEELPHGDQILDALKNGRLNEVEWADVAEGAEKAKVLYLRMLEWCLTGEGVVSLMKSA